MNLLRQINFMVDDAIAKARNEGFVEGVKWQKEHPENTPIGTTKCPGDPNCTCDAVLTTGEQLALIHEENDNDPIIEEYDKDGRECLISCECRNEDTGPLYYVDHHRVTKEQYDWKTRSPKERYEMYNDEVWPGENQAEEGDGE